MPSASVVPLEDGAGGNKAKDSLGALDLVSKETDGRDVGFLGEKGVNVLLLNLDLDKAAGPPSR